VKSRSGSTEAAGRGLFINFFGCRVAGWYTVAPPSLSLVRCTRLVNRALRKVDVKRPPINDFTGDVMTSLRATIVSAASGVRTDPLRLS